MIETIKQLIAVFLATHPKVKSAITFGKVGSNLRSKLGTLLAWMVFHAGITVPAMLLVATGASVALYQAGFDAGTNMCRTEQAVP